MKPSKRAAASAIAIGALIGATQASAVTSAGRHVKRSASLSANPNGLLRFNKKKLSVRHGKVTLHMHDPGSSGLSHGIAISGNGVNKVGPIVSPGQVANVTVKLKPGRYTFYCPVPGHRAAGMRGTLIVK